MQSVVFSTVSSALVNVQHNPSDKNHRQAALLVGIGAMGDFLAGWTTFRNLCKPANFGGKMAL